MSLEDVKAELFEAASGTYVESQARGGRVRASSPYDDRGGDGGFERGNGRSGTAHSTYRPTEAYRRGEDLGYHSDDQRAVDRRHFSPSSTPPRERGAGVDSLGRAGRRFSNPAVTDALYARAEEYRHRHEQAVRHEERAARAAAHPQLNKRSLRLAATMSPQRVEALYRRSLLPGGGAVGRGRAAAHDVYVDDGEADEGYGRRRRLGDGVGDSYAEADAPAEEAEGGRDYGGRGGYSDGEGEEEEEGEYRGGGSSDGGGGRSPGRGSEGRRERHRSGARLQPQQQGRHHGSGSPGLRDLSPHGRPGRGGDAGYPGSRGEGHASTGAAGAASGLRRMSLDAGRVRDSVRQERAHRGELRRSTGEAAQAAEATFHPRTTRLSAQLAGRRNPGGVSATERLYADAQRARQRKEDFVKRAVEAQLRDCSFHPASGAAIAQTERRQREATITKSGVTLRPQRSLRSLSPYQAADGSAGATGDAGAGKGPGGEKGKQGADAKGDAAVGSAEQGAAADGSRSGGASGGASGRGERLGSDGSAGSSGAGAGAHPARPNTQAPGPSPPPRVSVREGALTYQRQLGWLREREERLHLERLRAAERELVGCTFAPATAANGLMPPPTKGSAGSGSGGAGGGGPSQPQGGHIRVVDRLAASQRSDSQQQPQQEPKGVDAYMARIHRARQIAFDRSHPRFADGTGWTGAATQPREFHLSQRAHPYALVSGGSQGGGGGASSSRGRAPSRGAGAAPSHRSASVGGGPGLWEAARGTGRLQQQHQHPSAAAGSRLDSRGGGVAASGEYGGYGDATMPQPRSSSVPPRAVAARAPPPPAAALRSGGAGRRSSVSGAVGRVAPPPPPPPPQSAQGGSSSDYGSSHRSASVPRSVRFGPDSTAGGPSSRGAAGNSDIYGDSRSGGAGVEERGGQPLSGAALAAPGVGHDHGEGFSRAAAAQGRRPSISSAGGGAAGVSSVRGAGEGALRAHQPQRLPGGGGVAGPAADPLYGPAGAGAADGLVYGWGEAQPGYPGAAGSAPGPLSAAPPSRRHRDSGSSAARAWADAVGSGGGGSERGYGEAQQAQASQLLQFASAEGWAGAAGQGGLSEAVAQTSSQAAQAAASVAAVSSPSGAELASVDDVKERLRQLLAMPGAGGSSEGPQQHQQVGGTPAGRATAALYRQAPLAPALGQDSQRGGHQYTVAPPPLPPQRLQAAPAAAAPSSSLDAYFSGPGAGRLAGAGVTGGRRSIAAGGAGGATFAIRLAGMAASAAAGGLGSTAAHGSGPYPTPLPLHFSAPKQPQASAWRVAVPNGAS